ncbi:MAG: GAF domain-containing protein, partial [Actinobacteria bacterium]
MEFLSEATASLSAAVPDYEATLERVARLAVPALADVCLIDVVEDDGTLRRVTTRHADPIQSAGAQSLGRFPLDPTRPDPALAVLQSGRPFIVPEVPRSMTGIAQHQEHLALLRSMGASSLMILPLTARLRALGTITFVTTSSGRTYGDEDRALAEELARRAALVV